MKFLDLNGLTHFFGKVKTWTGNNYLSLKGGNVDGSITANLGFIAKDPDTEVSAELQPGTGLSIYNNKAGNIVLKAAFGENEVYAPSFRKTNGTSTQALIADGSVKGIGSANGIAGLDSNGYVPLSQLGNLDTTVAEVVTALPTTNIKKHIYLVKDASGVTQNQYEEYLYTGDTSAAYDASKWEKLGDFRATVDLADYAKKMEAVNVNGIELTEEVISNTGQSLISKQSITFSNINGGDATSVTFKDATTGMAGFMSIRDKNKLDRLDISKLNTNSVDISKLFIQNDTQPPVAASDSSIVLSFYTVNDTSKSYIIGSATTQLAGVMSAAAKRKLTGIADGATADSAITTAEIDALFA